MFGCCCFRNSMASSDLIRPPAVKFSEHVVTTIKHIQEQEYSVTASQCLSAGRRRGGRRKRVRHKVVRIIHIDGDATDSSGDDEAQVVQRVKRHVTEISFQPPPHERLVLRLPPPSGSGRKKFRGVRQRPWGGGQPRSATRPAAKGCGWGRTTLRRKRPPNTTRQLSG